jgi:hypothetical protein
VPESAQNEHLVAASKTLREQAPGELMVVMTKLQFSYRYPAKVIIHHISKLSHNGHDSQKAGD